MRTNVFVHACCVHLQGPLPPWRWWRPISPEMLCLHGGTFQDTMFLRNLLNGDQFSKSKYYTVTVPGGGGYANSFIVSFLLNQCNVTCAWTGSNFQVGVSALTPCAWPGFSLSQWKFPRHGATNESLQDWRLELSIVDNVQGSRSVLQQPRWKVDLSLTGDDTWRGLFMWFYV